MSNVIPIHGSTWGSKYGPGSPYDQAARAARDLPPGPDKAAAFEHAAEHALGCTWRSGGWTALGECNCMKPVDPREAHFDLRPHRWMWVAFLWFMICAIISVVVISQLPVL